MDIEAVKATVARGNQSAGNARAVMAETGDQIDEAHRMVATTAGSDHDQVRLGRTRLKEARAEAKRVVDLLAAATGAAEEFRRALG